MGLFFAFVKEWLYNGKNIEHRILPPYTMHVKKLLIHSLRF